MNAPLHADRWNGGNDERPPRWGRWGADDEHGALNFLTAEGVRRAVRLVSEGRVVPLGMALGPHTPVPDHRKHVERLMVRDGGDYAAGGKRPGGFQFAEEVISLAAHTGTHIDALAHAWYDDLLYNGFSGDSVRSTTGAQRCGADRLVPIVTRGILVDIASNREAGVMAAGEPVTERDLRSAYEAQGVVAEAGDVVLLRTGWNGTHAEDELAYHQHEPGLSVEGARWLADAGVAAIGADNYAVEVVPPEREGDVFPVHQLLLRDYGVPLIENLVLDELARAGFGPFLFVASPLPLVGGTASPLCPLAIL